MSAKDVKTDRKYTKEHEWALLAQGKLTVGITAFAVDQLGDVTLVNFDVAVGERVIAKSRTERVNHAGIRMPAVFSRAEGSQAAAKQLKQLPGSVDIAVRRAEVLVAKVLGPNVRQRGIAPAGRHLC